MKILSHDYSNRKDHTVVSAILEEKDIEIGDNIIVDASWTQNKFLHGDYVVLSKFEYYNTPMVELIRFEEGEMV
jgi:hypothetical protein